MMQSELNKLREEIERLDADIIAAIARRVQLARDIGAAKRALQLPTLDPAREAAVVRRAVGIARDAGLSFDDEIRQIFWQLIGLSRRVQQGEA